MNSMALMLALSVLPSAPAGKGPSLAVLNLEHKTGVSADTADLLTQNLITTLSSQGRFGRVIGTKEIENVIGFEKQRQLMSCDSQSCIAELAGAMGVDYVLTGSLGKLGTKYLFNATLVNTRTAEVEGRVSKTISGNDESALLEAVETVVTDLLRGSSASAAAPVAAAPSAPAKNTAPVASNNPPPANPAPAANNNPQASNSGGTTAAANTPPANNNGNTTAAAGDPVAQPEPVAANAGNTGTTAAAPATEEKPASGGGMMGLVLKGAGGAGLAVAALTFLVSVIGVVGGLGSAGVLMAGLLVGSGRGGATAGNAGFYGGLGVGALALVLTLVALGTGAGLLVAGFVLG